MKTDINDTLRAKGPDAVRERYDRAHQQTAAKRIEETLEVFKRWLLLDDVTPILAVLGAVAANYLEGDPVWLALSDHHHRPRPKS